MAFFRLKNLKSVYTRGYRNITCNISGNAAHRQSGCFAFHFYDFFLVSFWISDEVICVLCGYVEFDAYELFFSLSIEMLT